MYIAIAIGVHVSYRMGKMSMSCWQAQLVLFYLVLGLFDTTIDSLYNNARDIVATYPSVPWWALYVMDGCVVLFGLLVIFFQGKFAHVTSPDKRTAQVLSRFTTFYFGIACTESGLAHIYAVFKLRVLPGLQLPSQHLLADVVAAGAVSIGLFYLYRFSAIRTEVAEMDVLSQAQGGEPRHRDTGRSCPRCRCTQNESGGTAIN
jgi:hypothetical protein